MTEKDFIFILHFQTVPLGGVVRCSHLTRKDERVIQVRDGEGDHRDTTEQGFQSSFTVLPILF